MEIKFCIHNRYGECTYDVPEEDYAEECENCPYYVEADPREPEK